jgi:hypothetical protein
MYELDVLSNQSYKILFILFTLLLCMIKINQWKH